MATGALLSIKLRCASWQQLATIYQRDLSRGTMFLKASTPPAIGTSVRIDLTLPSASVIVLTGVVHQHVSDLQRGAGVELKLSPIPAGSVWLIESALASEQRRGPAGDSKVQPATPGIKSGPVMALTDGSDVAAAEAELIKALGSEAESLKKLNPFLVLGVGYNANDAEVRAAFGELTKKYHPDRFARYESPDLRAVAAEIFILIRDAYRKLGDAAGRSQTLTAIGKPSAQTSPPNIPTRAQTQPSSRTTPTAGVPKVMTDVRSGPVRTVDAIHEVGTVRKPPEPSLLDDRPTPKPVNLHDAGTVKKSEIAIPAAADKAPNLPTDAAAVEEMVDAGKLDEAIAAYKLLAKKHPSDRVLKAGIELCEGLRALNARDRLEAAQRFEAALEIDPSNERAARELADMRRHATNERKGLLSRLMGKKE